MSYPKKCLLSILFLFMTMTARPVWADSWVPVDGPYSIDAAQALFQWVQEHIADSDLISSSVSSDVKTLRNLITGTLIWAYSYGSSFHAETFLRHFANRDDSVRYLKLQNGGLIFVLDSCNFKISRDNAGPEDRITPNSQSPDPPRERWYASAFNTDFEISFYFSAVGPYSSLAP